MSSPAALYARLLLPAETRFANAESVPRKHVRIGRERGSWHSWHVSPTNPTIVIRCGIEQVISRPGYRELIQPGDRLRLGRLEVKVVGN